MEGGEGEGGRSGEGFEGEGLFGDGERLEGRLVDAERFEVDDGEVREGELRSPRSASLPRRKERRTHLSLTVIRRCVPRSIPQNHELAPLDDGATPAARFELLSQFDPLPGHRLATPVRAEVESPNDESCVVSRDVDAVEEVESTDSGGRGESKAGRQGGGEAVRVRDDAL